MIRRELGDRFGDSELADAFDAFDNLPRPRQHAPRFLTEMADVLRAAGLTVTEQEGWTTRARSSGGYDTGRPWCVMWHHAASAPGATAESVANYASYGSDVAPVCNLVLGRDGDVIVCAAGPTNTNGTGGPYTVSRGTVPADQMNTYAIGIEAVNDGVGEPWPQVQIDAYFAMNNALAFVYGLEPEDCCMHSVWAPSRKIDPARASAVEGPWRPASTNSSGSWALSDIQFEARRRWAALPEPEPPPVEDDEMNTAIMWRPAGYLNTFLIGVGAIVHLSPLVAAELDGRGVLTIVEADGNLLQSCLWQTGMNHDQLVPGGG